MRAMPGCFPAPLVSILVPTYNRANQLSAALDSALAQSHRPIEIVVSDNASSDETPSICQRYAMRHPELRVVRHDENCGPTRNFESLRDVAHGEYMMFLGDDDWLDVDYVSRCLEVFREHPDATVVAGRAMYHPAPGVPTFRDESVTIDDQDPSRRVIAYFRSVIRNGVFYGLVRTSADRQVEPLRNRMGNDWLHVAALAFLGQMRVIDEVAIHRSAGGMTTSLRHVARGLGLGPVQANVPLLAIVYWVFEDIAIGSDLYRPLRLPRRITLASKCAGLLLVRFAGLVATRAQARARSLRNRFRNGA